MNTNIKIAGMVTHLLLDKIGEFLKGKATAFDVNLFAERFIKENYPNCKLACKGYRNFPCSLCVSINEEIVHGIPSNRIINYRDVIKVDLVIEYNGWYADSARTYVIDNRDKTTKKLIKVAKKALYKAIKIARPNVTTGDIGYTIQKYVEHQGFSVIKEYGGHGIGQKLHQKPSIPCFGDKGTGDILTEGMTLAIETMIFAGKSDIEIDKNGWTVKAKDKSLTAHFEHTILITKNSSVILT